MGFFWSSNAEFSAIIDELDKMLAAMDSIKWNFALVKSYVAIVRIVCAQLKDFELLYVIQQELLMKHFWRLPIDQKWQPLSLMTEYLSGGGATNAMGNQVAKKITRTQLESMIRKCPDKDTKRQLTNFRLYLK